MTLGKRLQLVRTNKGLTHKDLEISAQQLAGYEQDVNLPRLGKLLQMSEVLGLSASWLAWGVGASTNYTDQASKWFCARMAAARRKNKMTYADVGACFLSAPKHKQQIHAWEHGPHYPSIATIWEIGEILQVKPDWLAWGKAKGEIKMWEVTSDPAVTVLVVNGVPMMIHDANGFTEADYKKLVKELTGIDKDRISIPAKEWTKKGDGAECPVYVDND